VQLEGFVQPDIPRFDWMSFRGVVLEGGYQLGDMIAADSQFAAFRVRVLGDASLDAIAQFYACDPANADEQLAVWKTIQELAHPNLHTPLAIGKREVDGCATLYVVLKRVEERLSGALEERTLRPSEASELVTSLHHALEALHKRRLVHGCISPEHVLATETAILLSTECVRAAGAKSELEAIQPKYVAPESTVQNLTPEADIWCLGATLFEALTQTECGSSWREEITGLPQPFRRIVQRCLETDPANRATLVEIATLNSGREPSGAKLPTAPAVPAKGPVPVAPPESTPSPVLVSVPKPAAKSRTSTPGASYARRRQAWLYVAVAVLVAIAVVALARIGRRSEPHPAAGPPQATHSAASGQNNTAWPTRTLSPEGSTSNRTAESPRESVPPPTVTSQKQGSAYVNGPVWRVVLYTYDRESDAQAMAKRLSEKYPQLKIESFSPSGHRGPYLVVVGGQMDRDTAVRLRRQVVRMGLPRDAYVQNFRH
jgi:serine/threonine protein kinase